MQTRVGVQPGEGLVARFGDTLLVVDTSGNDPFVDELLRTVETATDDVVWAVAALVTAARGTAPRFGILFTDHRRVLLHGAVRAILDETTDLSGTEAVTWVDRPIEAASVALTLVEQGDVMPDTRSDLRAGVLSGVGLVVTLGHDRQGHQQNDQQRELPPTTSVPSGSVRFPTPAADQPTGPVSAVQQTVAVRPAINVLVADDGSRTPLDRDYVFGRDPRQHPAVTHGDASPVQLRDQEQLISRIQAVLRVQGDTVTIEDAASANGTFIAAPGAAEWTRLPPHPVPLPVNWSIRMGRRVFTHRAAG